MERHRLVVAAAVLLATGGCTIGRPLPPVRPTILETHGATQAPGSPGTNQERLPPKGPDVPETADE